MRWTDVGRRNVPRWLPANECDRFSQSKTLAAFALAAVVARGRFMGLLQRSEAVRAKVGWELELAGALAAVALGLSMMAGSRLVS